MDGSLMKETIQRQYNAVRDAIKHNIEGIRTLLEQADSITELVEQLDTTVSQETITALKQSVSTIHDTISTMFIQLKELHQKTEIMVETMIRRS